MKNLLPLGAALGKATGETPKIGARSTTDFKQLGVWAGLIVVLILAFLPVLRQWFSLSRASDLQSHVILIPLVSIYLLMTGRMDLDWSSRPSRVAGGVLIGLSVASWFLVKAGLAAMSETDAVACEILIFLGCVWGLGLLTMGWTWMKSGIFPMGFLVFMMPLPDGAVVFLEHQLMVWSAQVSEAVFRIGGIPVFRDGQILELPGVVLEVAEECSGIRSTWVLLITSILAAYLFIPKGPRRLILVAAVLPLGVLRNAVRIFVIGWLCVNYGNEMIDSWIHRKGGPVFFAGSLLPLFLLAWWLRKRNTKDSPKDPATADT